MAFLLILPILVSGFLVYHNHPLYFQKLHRHEGQYLYIQCAQLGIQTLLFSVALVVTANWLFSLIPPSCLRPESLKFLAATSSQLIEFGLSKQASADFYSTLVWAILISLFPVPQLWGMLSRYAYYRLWLGARDDKQVKVTVSASIHRDSPLDYVLFESAVKQQPIMLSMSDRKVYIGVVTSTGEPNETEGPDQEINLLLMTSGYRDKDKLTVTFTTKYSEVKVQPVITLKQDLIVSASPFDPEQNKKLVEYHSPKIPELDL